MFCLKAEDGIRDWSVTGVQTCALPIYLPITRAAYELTRAQGYYDRNPGTDTAIRQITLNQPTENSKGLRLGSFVQIRDVIEEELEQALAGKKTAKIALENAVKRGNELLRQFERANK